MPKIEGVILDWAGTTVDYGCFAPVQVFIDIFKHAGIDVYMHEAREPMGKLKRDHITAMLEMPRIQQAWQSQTGALPTERDIDALYAQFEAQLMHTLGDYTTPLPYVVETIKQLQTEGYRIGTTTGYTAHMMSVVAESAAQQGYVPDSIVTAEDVAGYGRPYPYMIFENMRRLRLSSVSRVVKVGDTIADIEEAIHAGVIAVGVVEGSSILGYDASSWATLDADQREQSVTRATELFQAHGAHAVIRNMSELPELLKTWYD